MFARAFFAAALVVIAAAAPEGRKPEVCKDVPVVTVPDVSVVAESKICSPLPAGVCGSGVMVANVTYELNCAFGCPTTTTIWCEGNTVVDEKKKTCAPKYWFCCGKDCKGMPDERKCEYDGKEYTVGTAYDLGNGKTMWCVDEETPVTCTGKECGSTLNLTPPRVETCPAPPMKPLPPKPHPEPECRRDKDCKCPFNLACECKHGKCVPAEGPFPDDESSYCRSAMDCPANHRCTNGQCVKVTGPQPDVDPEMSYCRSAMDCPANHRCTNGQCVKVTGPQPDVDPEMSFCRSAMDCPANHRCTNGQCVKVNRPQPEVDPEMAYCRSAMDCPAHHRCTNGQCVKVNRPQPDVDPEMSFPG